MQEHTAIDVSPGPIRPIHLISDCFLHLCLLSLPCAAQTHGLQRRPPSTLHPSCSQSQSQRETQMTAASGGKR